MSMMFVALVVIAAGLAFYFFKQTSETLSQLKADGFTVDQELGSNPRIVIDKQQKRLALIYAKDYELIDFSQVVSADYQHRPGDDDRQLRRVLITLKDHTKDHVRVSGRQEAEMDGWIETLNNLQ